MANESFRRAANRTRSNWRLTIGQPPKLSDHYPLTNPANVRRFDDAMAQWTRQLEGDLRRTIEQALGNTRDEPTAPAS
jgi:hypothetical protein